MKKFNVGVVGAGYVGLATGACLSHIGHHVTLIDTDEDKIAVLKQGKTPIYEPGLEELLAEGSARLEFTAQLGSTAREVDVLFIAVGTPSGKGGLADLSGVTDVAHAIGWSLSGFERERPLVVVNKSTAPVGSGDYVSMLVREGAQKAGSGPALFHVVSNPEFLREGSAIYDSLFPDRIVLGTESREALEVMRELYEPIVNQSFPTGCDPRPRAAVPCVKTDLASAEMIKYAANAFLATKISFINEIANVCELVGADVSSVATGIGLDARIGPRFLDAGIGWGGSCLPKDVAALRAVAAAYGYETKMLSAATEINGRQRRRVVSKLQQDLHPLGDKRVALLGLAFKPGTDDLREAPSLEIARELASLGTRVVGYDPVAGKLAAGSAADLFEVVYDPYEALAGAHAAVLATEWEEFRALDLEKAASLMQEPRLMVDGRNVFDPKAARAAGLLYQGFGRG